MTPSFFQVKKMTAKSGRTGRVLPSRVAAQLCDNGGGNGIFGQHHRRIVGTQHQFDHAPLHALVLKTGDRRRRCRQRKDRGTDGNIIPENKRSVPEKTAPFVRKACF